MSVSLAGTLQNCEGTDYLPLKGAHPTGVGRMRPQALWEADRQRRRRPSAPIGGRIFGKLPNPASLDPKRP